MIRILKVVAQAALCGTLLFAASAHALPIISGTFTLTNDGSNFPIPANEVIATGTFTTGAAYDPAPFLDPAIAGAFVGLDTVAITTFTIVDRTGDIAGLLPAFANSLGNFELGVNATSTEPFFAVLDDGVPQGVAGFHGSIARDSSPLTSFDFNGLNIAFNGFDEQGGFIVNNAVIVGESGVQNIPEPGALALLGMGVFAFGFARHRGRKVESESV